MSAIVIWKSLVMSPSPALRITTAICPEFAATPSFEQVNIGVMSDDEIARLGTRTLAVSLTDVPNSHVPSDVFGSPSNDPQPHVAVAVLRLIASEQSLPG